MRNMNPREAIIELNRIKTASRMPTDYDRRDRAIETAKAALEKQIPAKPIRGEDSYFCCPNPNCKGGDGAVRYDFIAGYLHCTLRGQRLDWSEKYLYD